MNLPVFRQGRWIVYTLPENWNLSWNGSQKLQAASFYATAITKGYSPNESHILTECYMNKIVFPGLQYNETLEKQIKDFLV